MASLSRRLSGSWARVCPASTAVDDQPGGDRAGVQRVHGDAAAGDADLAQQLADAEDLAAGQTEGPVRLDDHYAIPPLARGNVGEWCLANPTPLVLLVDEIDSLVGDTLLSVLR